MPRLQMALWLLILALMAYMFYAYGPQSIMP